MPDDIYRNQFVGTQPAWHRKGHPLPPGTTAIEAMAAAGQSGWDVRALPLEIPGVDSRGLHVLVRNDAGEVVIASDSLVTAEYAPISNEEVFGPMVELLTGMDMPVDAAGVMGRLGNRAFMTFDAGSVQLAEGERFAKYLVALSRHTGRDADYILPTGVRVVCANTEAYALRTARALLTIPHTRAGIDAFYSSAEASRQIMGLTEHYERMLYRQFERLTRVGFDDADWVLAVEVYANSRPPADTGRKTTLAASRVRALHQAWDMERTWAEAAGVPATTLWTAKQAVSTWAQHTAPGGPGRADSRALRLAIGEQVPLVNQLHAAVASVVRNTPARASTIEVDRALAWLGAS